jgi:hypothetical protein
LVLFWAPNSKRRRRPKFADRKQSATTNGGRSQQIKERKGRSKDLSRNRIENGGKRKEEDPLTEKGEGREETQSETELRRK